MLGGKPHGRMAIQAGKSITSMPSVGLHPTNWIREDVIFFCQPPDLSLPTSKVHLSDSDFLQLWWRLARHFTMTRVYLQCLGIWEASAKLRNRMAEKGRQ
ncbi:hypothetical protein AVEN_112224-1 [Araneus ventricosus]|uniref:Uncharacterized protein n=1 Tax=Araneus ventricosus TaxID=182803 RepID=A0A4Y2UBY7_ARAVE|nr:hypothetical protein AVEN_112224-1 [Araneus ventricosus]